MYKAAGAISDEEMLTFRQLGSRLEGHPTPVLPWVDVATGSLGQGLPIGVGVALAGKWLDRLAVPRLGACAATREMAEGSIWEAFEHAAFNELDNLTAIIDVNRLGQTGETMHGWDLDVYAQRARGLRLARHRDRRPRRARRSTRPTPRRHRDQGQADLHRRAHREGPGGRRGGQQERCARQAARRTRTRPSRSWAGCATSHVDVPKPTSDGEPHVFETTGALELPRYELGEQGGDAQGLRRRAGGARQRRRRRRRPRRRGRQLDLLREFEKAHPERFFEMYIAEQQLVAAAVGMQVRGWRPFASTFAAFLTPGLRLRAHGAPSARPTCSLVGSHAGV